MKKLVSKVFTVIVLALTVCALAVFLAACGGDDGNNGGTARSELIGGFESNESRDVSLTNDESLIGEYDAHGDPYLYTTEIYPLNTIENESVRYTTYQKLRLKRDFSYEYSLEIMLRKVTKDGNTDLVKLEATTKGTFTYTQNEGENYSVEMSDPVSGDEKRYGSFITGEGNIYSWKLSSSPNYSVDVAHIINSAEADEEGAGPEFDRYIKGRQVSVEKSGTERMLYSSAFYLDLLDDIAPYCSYDFSSATSKLPVAPDVPATPSKPDDPDNPDMPSETVGDTALAEQAHGNVSAALVLSGGMRIRLTAPATVESVTYGDRTVDEYTEVNGNRLFYVPVAYADFDDTVTVVAGEQFEFSVADYLKSMIPTDKVGVADSSAGYAAIALLNAAKHYGADGIELTDGMTLPYSANDSYYKNAWQQRVYMTQSGSMASGFSWVGAKEGHSAPLVSLAEDGTPTLTYDFKAQAPKGDGFTAKVTVGSGAPKDAAVADGGDGTYRVSVTVSDYADYTAPVTVAIYDGKNLISGNGTYSVTRGLAYIESESSDDALKAHANHINAVIKNVEWYANRDQVGYGYCYSNGLYNFSFGDYVYAVSGDSVFGLYQTGVGMYLGGKIVDDNTASADTSDHSATLTRGAETAGKYPFTATLKGGRLDSIAVLDPDNGFGSPVAGATAGEKQGGLTVTVEDDTVLNGIYNDGWDPLKDCYGNYYASIYALCDITITGAPGKKLTVTGGIFTPGSLTVTGGVQVEVLSSLPDRAAITAKSLTVGSNSSLALRRIVNVRNEVSGAVLTDGIADISGELVISGFDNGLMLDDGEATGIVTVSGSLDIDALHYGIAAKSYDVDNVFQPRLLKVDGGSVTVNIGVFGRAAFAPMNIEIKNGGALDVKVLHGVGIEKTTVDGYWEDWSQSWVPGKSTRPFYITLHGTEPGIDGGKLHFDVRGGGYIAELYKLDVTCGDVYFYSEGAEVIRTVSHTVGSGDTATVTTPTITFDNCDVLIESGAHGHGINAQSNSTIITVTKTAIVSFKNIRAAVACYGEWPTCDSDWYIKLADNMPLTADAVVINNGRINIDGYYKWGKGLPRWRGEDSLYTIVAGDGQILRANEWA